MNKDEYIRHLAANGWILRSKFCVMYGDPKILELYATVSYRKYGLVLSDQLYARRVTVSRLCVSLRGVTSMLLSDYQRRYFAISISSASVFVIRADCSGVTQPRTSNER